MAQRSPASAPLTYKVSELVLHTVGTINQFERKAGFGIALDNYAIATNTFVAPDTIVQRDNVVNLTGKMKANGR